MTLNDYEWPFYVKFSLLQRIRGYFNEMLYRNLRLLTYFLTITNSALRIYFYILTVELVYIT